MTQDRLEDVADMQENKAGKRDPAQVAAQVAATSQAPAPPLLHSHTEPESKPHLTLQLEDSKSDAAAQMPAAASRSGTPLLGLGSPKDTEAKVQAEVAAPSHPETDASTVPEAQPNGQKGEEPQDHVPAHHTTPLTPPPTQGQDAKTSTAPSAAPHPDEQKRPKSASALASPRTTAATTSSKRAASPLTKFRNCARIAKYKYMQMSKIFDKTRAMMRSQSSKMSILASRGFERGLLPTRRTRPPLLKRRYSIDVNTIEAWDTRPATQFDPMEMEYEVHQPKALTLEPLPTLSHTSSFPFPGRYAAFCPTFMMRPAVNSDVYLSLGDITIHNDAFHDIGATTWRDGEPWMCDESLDMALEVLRRDSDCDSHAITIASTAISQICVFATRSTNSTSNEYAEYEAKLRGKRWIFLVVNDGIGSFETDRVQGSHWTLLAVSRVNRTVYHYDSLYSRRGKSQKAAEEIGLGLLAILGEDTRDWRFRPQVNTPNQNKHNRFRNDSGACGPFVYKMAEILIEHIKRQQALGKEDGCELFLGKDFASQFGHQFDSWRIRQDIKKRIARWKAMEFTVTATYAHDESALADTYTQLDDGPVAPLEIPHGPRAPIQDKTQAGSQRTPHNQDRDVPTDVEDEDDVADESSNNSDNSTQSFSDAPSTVVEESDSNRVDTEEMVSDDDEGGGIDISNFQEDE